MKKSVVASGGGLYTLIVTDGGMGIELYGPYRDVTEQEAYRRDWQDEGALESASAVAVRLTVRGAVEIETF